MWTDPRLQRLGTRTGLRLLTLLAAWDTVCGGDFIPAQLVGKPLGEYPHFQYVRTFIREAHRRGLKVITELVCNHTSDQHAWFQRARRAAWRWTAGSSSPRAAA